MFSSIWVKLGAAAAVFAIVFGGGMFIYNHIYDSGYDAGKASVQVQLDELTKEITKAHDDAVSQKITTDAVIKDIDAKAKLAIAVGQTQAQVQTKTITKVIHDNPTFATVVRPLDLDGVRISQLEAIRDCCRAGQDGKAASPAVGSPAGVPGPDDSSFRIKPRSN